jgi:hypothetical protein
MGPSIPTLFLAELSAFALFSSPNCSPHEPVFVNVEPRNRFRQAGNRFLRFLKGLQIRALGRVIKRRKIYSLEKTRVYSTVYLFTQGRGGGELTREKVRGATVHKGVKNTNMTDFITVWSLSVSFFIEKEPHKQLRMKRKRRGER